MDILLLMVQAQIMTAKGKSVEPPAQWDLPPPLHHVDWSLNPPTHAPCLGPNRTEGNFEVMHIFVRLFIIRFSL